MGFIIGLVVVLVLVGITIIGLSLSFKGVNRQSEVSFSLKNGIKYKRK
jgi:hypothetical protein